MIGRWLLLHIHTHMSTHTHTHTHTQSSVSLEPLRLLPLGASKPRSYRESMQIGEGRGINRHKILEVSQGESQGNRTTVAGDQVIA